MEFVHIAYTGRWIPEPLQIRLRTPRAQSRQNFKQRNDEKWAWQSAGADKTTTREKIKYKNERVKKTDCGRTKINTVQVLLHYVMSQRTRLKTRMKNSYSRNENKQCNVPAKQVQRTCKTATTLPFTAKNGHTLPSCSFSIFLSLQLSPTHSVKDILV